MASSQVKFSLFTVFLIVLVAVAAAHDGHDHHAPAGAPPAESNAPSSLNSYHAVIGGLSTFLLTFFIAKDRL